jgi:type IV pilus assembly protein PilC
VQNKKDLNDLYQIFIVIQQNALSGLSIPDALNMYEETTTRPKIKRILKEIRTDMERGVRMADAFAKHPDLFPAYIIEMMRVNEGTGQSNEIYTDIVKTLEQQIDLRRNISSQKGQMIFLGVLLVLTICIVIFLVLPSMGKLMMGTGMAIPWYTKFLLAVGNGAKEFWWLIAAIVAGLYFATKTAARKNPRQLAKILLNLPLYGKIYYNQAQYRFALIFGLCKNSGLDTIRALKFTRDSCGNILMADLIDKAIRDIDRYGSNLVITLQKHNKHNILDKSYYMFLKAGEKGDMGHLMSVRADFFKKQLIVASQQFSQDMQNLILAPTFGFLALILLSVLAPLFSMMSSMSSGGMGTM